MGGHENAHMEGFRHGDILQKCCGGNCYCSTSGRWTT